MSRLVYRSWKPGAAALETIGQANAICEEYAAQGYDLTLRQLYYQFVARGLLANTVRSYKRLGSVVNDARLAGLMDWDFIVDRTRSLSGASHFDKPGDAVKLAARKYAEDLWASQPLRVEVWVEKEALAGVIQRVAAEHDVDWFACRGYVSQSELWSAGQRFLDYLRRRQRVLVLHLGDHDPSGIDMTRDIRERLDMFVERDFHRANLNRLGSRTTLRRIRQLMQDDVDGEEPIEVRRIALNMDQVLQYEPPPNPAKLSDSRSASYVAEYGDESWELDALEPQVLAELVTRHVVSERDDLVWEQAVAREAESRATMVRVADRWDEVAELTREQA